MLRMHRFELHIVPAAVVVSVVVLSSGCGSDCDDTTRLDGDWTVASRVATEGWQVTGFDTENTDPETANTAKLDQARLLAQLPVNGTRTWQLARDGESDNYSLRIDGREYDARLISKKGTCNALELSFDGAWDGDEGSLHNFSFDGQLNFLGDEITGEWKYSDNFSWDDLDITGTVAIPSGVFSGTLAGADTGL